MYTQLLILGIETKSLGLKCTFNMCLLPEWHLPGKHPPFLGRAPSWETPHLPGKGTFLGTPNPSWNAHHPGKDLPSWNSHPRKGRCFLGSPLPRKGLPFPGRLPPFPDDVKFSFRHFLSSDFDHFSWSPTGWQSNIWTFAGSPRHELQPHRTRHVW